MPTKFISKALMGTIAATALSAPAFAGGACGVGVNCNTGVQVMDGYQPSFGPMTVRNENPMGHLRSVNFQRSPNVSITRVHGMAPNAGLSDAPSGFTNGCHPTSTQYCRQDAGRPVTVELAPQPVFQPAPAPVVMAPVPSEPRVVRIGGGYDPSKFTPRVYGDATFVPGIAHVPTSIVDRDPVRAQQVLDTGRAVPHPVVVPGQGTAPHMGMVRQAPQPQVQTMPGYGITLPNTYAAAPMPSYGITLPNTYAAAPMMGGQPFGQAGAPRLQRGGPMDGTYGSTVGQDGSYWEKVSGPTFMGDTLATSVICKRKLPTQVVNPVVPVPYPVPVAVPAGCQEVKLPGGRYGHMNQKNTHHPKAHHGGHHQRPQQRPQQQPMQPQGHGRWVY